MKKEVYEKEVLAVDGKAALSAVAKCQTEAAPPKAATNWT